MVLFFLTLYLTTKLGYTISDAGTLISIYGFGSLAGAFIGGWLSDYFGTHRILVISLLLSGIGYILLGHLESFFSISLMLFFVALVSESFRPANATAVAESSPPELRSRAFALNRLAANLGITIGPAIGGFLARVDYIYLFWIDGATYLLAAGVFLIYIRGNLAAKNMAPEVERIESRSPFQDRIVLFILFLMLLMGITFVQIFNTWPLFLKTEYRLLESDIGTLLAINALLIVFIEMPLIHKIEKKEPLNIMSFGALLLFGGFALLPLNSAFLFVTFTVVLWTLGEILVFPLLTSYVANRADDSNRGKYMGMTTFTFALAFVIGPFFGTNIYELFGSTILWISVGALGVFASLGFKLLARKSHKNQRL